MSKACLDPKGSCWNMAMSSFALVLPAVFALLNLQGCDYEGPEELKMKCSFPGTVVGCFA